MKRNISFLVFSSVIALLVACVYKMDSMLFDASLNTQLSNSHIDINKSIQYINDLSKESRYVGSVGHKAAQTFIVNKLSSILQKDNIKVVSDKVDTVILNRYVEAPVTNIIGILKSDSNYEEAENIALFAHYDSAEASYGVNDNAVAVSTLLTIAEYASNKKKRDYNLYLIFVDAEEIGLLGSKSLVESNLLSNIHYAINFEARGSFGHSLIIETISKDGEALRFLDSMRNTPIDSILLDVYKMLPNMTDVDNIKTGVSEQFKLLLNTAYFGNGFAYHNEYDGPDAINLKGLKHQITQSINLLDYVSSYDRTDQYAAIDNYLLKSVSKNILIALPKTVVTIVSIIILLSLVYLYYTSYRAAALNRPVRFTVYRTMLGLVFPLLNTAIIVLICLISSRILGDEVALSIGILPLYLIIFIGSILLLMIAINRKEEYLSSYTLGFDILLILGMVVSISMSSSLMIILAGALLFRFVYLFLVYYFPQLSTLIGIFTISTSLIFNLHFFESLFYLGGIKLPLMLTLFANISLFANVNDFYRRLKSKTFNELSGDSNSAEAVL